MPQNNKPGRRLLRQLYGSWYRVRHNISIFVRWCLFAVIIGVVVGAVGGAVVVLISLLLGTRDYNGAGMQVIERAIAGHAAYEAFFLKLVLTAITIGVGYKGGEIVPVLFIGATFGAAYGGFFGLAPSFAAGLGMTAVFCGVTNSPLTSILLAYELFGGQSLALFALVIAIPYMLSGYYGLYSEQKIIYSKLRPQFIDRKTK